MLKSATKRLEVFRQKQGRTVRNLSFQFELVFELFSDLLVLLDGVLQGRQLLLVRLGLGHQDHLRLLQRGQLGLLRHQVRRNFSPIVRSLILIK